MHDLPRLHVITPAEVGAHVAEATRAAVAAGAPLVQLRTKDATDRARYRHTAELAGLCRAGGATVMVNDRADLAVALGADGVHVGDDDLPPEAVRAVLGPEPILGVTARDPEAGRRAVDAGATYLGVGPVRATSTKAGLPDPIGVAGVEAVARAVEVPVIAIGAVTAADVPALLDAGAWGVAVVGAVFGAPDAAAAVGELLEVLP